MSIATRVASIALVLMPGWTASGLRAGEASVPAPEPATTATAARGVRLRLGLLPAGADPAISLDGTPAVIVDGQVELPLGQTVRLAWRNGERALDLPVVAIDSSTGAMAPKWALDQPAKQPDGSVIIIGVGFAGDLAMAQTKALMNARMAGGRLLASTTTITTATEEAQERTMSERVSRTTISGAFTTAILDQCLTLAADPAGGPKPPQAPAVNPLEARLPAQARCWLRVRVALDPTAPAQPQVKPRTPEEVKRTVEELDRQIDQERKRQP